MRKTSVEPKQKFGLLTSISIHSKNRNGHIRWHCICDCGREKDILGTHLVSNKIKSCGCAIKRGKDHKQWTGYEGISGRLWNHIKRGADGSKGRGEIPFKITIQDVWELFQKQGGKCALSGVNITLSPSWNQWGDASLDRIDSSKGYTPENIQWVHKDVNKMKNSFDQSYFIDFCKKISQL